MKTILFLLLTFSFQIILSQNTVVSQNVYGGTDSDKMSGVTIVSDGTIWSGYYKSADRDFAANYGNYDCFLLKTDNVGVVWKKTFGGTQVDYLYDVTTDASGNIVAVGTSKSNDNDITGNHGNYDYLVVKLDATGVILWQKSFGGSDIDKATSVIATSDGGYLVLGYSRSTDGDITAGTSHGGYDLWLLKLDSAGTILWQKTYGGASDDKAGHIYEYELNYYIAAYSKSSDGDLTTNHGNYDYWIFSINNTGNIIWQKSYGGSGIDKEPVLSFSWLSIFVAGSSNSTDGDITNPLGNFDFWVLVLNEADGVLSWQKNIGGTGADFATGTGYLPRITRASSVYNTPSFVFGYSNSDDGDFPSNNGNYDAWYLELDCGGNVYNTTHFGGSDIDEFSGKYDEQNGIHFFGTTKSNDGTITGQHGNYDAWYIKFYPDSGGAIQEENLISIKTYPNPTSDYLQIEADNILGISIFDLQGERVFKQSNIDELNSFIIKLTNFHSGNYFVKVTTKDGVGISKILVK